MDNEQSIENNGNIVSSLNVLYVNNDESFCLHAKELIASYGCNLDFAQKGTEALSMFKLKAYDLLFVNYRMPDMNGFDIVKTMRSFESEHPERQAVIIILSEDDETDDMEKSFDIGCDGYLVKPIKKGDLLDIFNFLTADESENAANEEKSTKSEVKITVKIDKDIEGIVPEYLENIKDGCKKIHDAIARSDFEYVYRFGHNLKGTGTSYGFNDISAIGKILEQAGTDHNVEVTNEESKKLADYIDKVEVIYEEGI